MDIYIESVFIICLFETLIPLLLMERVLKRVFFKPFPAALSISFQYCAGLVLLSELTSDFEKGPGFGIMNMILGLAVVTLNLGLRLKPVNIGIFVILSWLSGIMTGGFLYYTYPGYLLLKMGPVSAILITLAGLYITAVRSLAGSLKEGITGSLFLKCRLIYGKEQIETKGFIDSGNRLYEPVSKKEVSIIEAASVRNIINLKPRGLFTISCKSIGNDKKLLFGITFDKLIIGEGSKKRIVRDAKVAIYKGTLSQRGDFELLLHGSYLKSEK